MSKRKAVVNQIVFELDNDDIESSSEDEIWVKNRSGKFPGNSLSKNVTSDDSCVEVVDMVVDSSDDEVIVHSDEPNLKLTENTQVVNGEESNDTKNVSCILLDNETDDTAKTIATDDSVEQIFTDTVLCNSPASVNNLTPVAGCENRTPLISVRFKDKKMANSYKQEIKKFMLKLIKLHEKENLAGSDNDTDLELDIWPEDLVQENEEIEEEQANIFFVDTAPDENESIEVPSYSKVEGVLSDLSQKEATPPTPGGKRPFMCFNCDGNHQLKDCPRPRNNARIAEKRKAINANRVGRYHVEDEQKYGHLVPGRISGKLRHALGLRRDELPKFIYRMRLLGYPPGWLEEARICHSGITMFDSTGKAIQEPDDEEGEICEPGSKDVFDIRKIHDFPGFNVPASSRYKEEAHLFNLPPRSEEDSKLHMLQALAPNAMKAYKRKKLTLFPSGSPTSFPLEGQAEMELDDGGETPEFPTVPPLPDEEPPAPPPPPPPPPELPPPSENSPPSPPEDCPRPKNIPLPPSSTVMSNTQAESLECKNTETTKNTDKVQMPNKQIDGINEGASQDTSADEISIVLSEEDEKSQSSGRESPSLQDLEEKKRLLLEALSDGKIPPKSPESELPDTVSQDSEKEKSLSDSESSKSQTVSMAPGHIKSTSYGTPVINVASSYTKLPTEDKFAKDICDVINFENLPDSVGKYEKISSLLKRVKSEVDRIQES